MNFKDLWKLSSKYEKINNNRKINIAIIILSTLMILMWFITISFFFETNKNLNKHKETLTAEVLYTDFDDVNSNPVSNIEKVNNLLNPKEVVSYTYFTLVNHEPTSWIHEFSSDDESWKIKIDDKERVYSNDSDSIPLINIGIYFEDESTNFYLNSEEEYFKNNNDKLFIYGNTFENDNDIIIDEAFAKKLDSNYSNLVGKTISISMKNKKRSHVRVNNEEVDEYYYKDKYFYILQEFRICGIISSNLINSESRYNKFDIWIKSDVINYDYFDFHETEYSYYYNYDKDVVEISNEITSNCLFFIPFGFPGLENENFEQRFQIMQFNSVDELRHIKYNLASNDINIKSLYHNMSFTESFYNYDKYFQVFKYINIISFVVSVVLLLIYLLINYIAIKDEYKKKELLIYTLKAIGMKNIDIFKVYLFRCIKQLIKLCLIILILSLFTVLVFSLLFNEFAIKRFDNYLIFNGFNMQYYPFAFISFSIIIIIILLLINIFVYKKNSNKKIHEVLNGQFDR